MAVCVEMAGIEPATATLAGRARYLSCHPRRQASASFASTCRLHGAYAMEVSMIQPVREASGRAFSGRSIRPEVNETAPEGLFPGAAMGKCLLALTRQPLRGPGQPKAAAPDSCIRAASAPDERVMYPWQADGGNGKSYFQAFCDAVQGFPATAPGYRWVGAGSRCGGAVGVRDLV
jgi:hypothetical protein